MELGFLIGLLIGSIWLAAANLSSKNFSVAAQIVYAATFVLIFASFGGILGYFFIGA